MSLVTVQRSPDSTSSTKSSTNSNDDLIISKPITTSLYNPTPTTKTTTTTNRFSLNLNRSNNKFTNELKNEFNNQSTSSLSTLSFTLATSKTTNHSNSTNLKEIRQCSFNQDEEQSLEHSTNFKNLKALYSSNLTTSNDSNNNRNKLITSITPSTNNSLTNSFNRSTINSNTIPYVNKKNQKNSKNSLLINQLSLNISDKQSKLYESDQSKSTNNNDKNNRKFLEFEIYKGIKPLEMNLTLTMKNRNLIEKYFVVKDAALILPKRSISIINSHNSNNHGNSNENLNQNSTLGKSSSFSFADLNEAKQQTEETTKLDQLDSSSGSNLNSSVSSGTGDILIHLQSMISLLRPNDTIILAVKLFSYVQERIRYLVIVETQSNKSNDILCEENAILGLDLIQINNQSESNETVSTQTDKDGNESLEKVSNKYFLCSVGLVLPIYANSEITLDGDGGFKFKSHQSTHIFKPVSIQAMWSAYQYLHKAFDNARKFNFYSIQTSGLASPSSSSSPCFNQTGNDLSAINNSNNLNNENLESHQNHEWVKYYTTLIGKNKLEQQSINEWYQKEERSAQREDFTTPYFDSLQLLKEQEEIGLKIKEKLKEIMMSSKDDYGSMSTVSIRQILEKELQLKLDNFKRFIDATIFQFYNQLVECATKILPYLYLGTEWNASNYDSLVKDGVTHILNVSSEVDNFFPDTFKYLNIRVLDIEETDLLKEFDRTNKFIQEAKEENSSCLVHCKMGVSRSASVVIAYLMKELSYTYEQAFSFTKQKRACINPNDGFRQQLSTYESILNAHRAKYNLFEPSPQTSSSTILSNAQLISNEGDNNKITDDLDVINQVGLSVKEAINKIKSMSSMDHLNTPIQSYPPISPSKKFNTSPPFVSRKSISLSPTNDSCHRLSSASLDINTTEKDVLHQPKVNIDEIPKFTSTLKIVKTNNNQQNLDQNFNLSIPNDSNLKHTQSCPNQMTTRSSINFKRLVKETDINETILESSNLSSINFTLSTENLDDTNLTSISFAHVPKGTVKRQVESINIKSKPIEYALIRHSTIDFEQSPNEKEQKLIHQTTTSPDSKRFKCELLQLINTNLDKGDSCLDNLDDEIKVLSQNCEFNKSKKLFEQLELQKDIEKEDMLKKMQKNEKIEESSTFKNPNRHSKLNATIS